MSDVPLISVLKHSVVGDREIMSGSNIPVFASIIR